MRFWNQLGLEYTLMWTIAAFYFLVHGGGSYSLDAVMRRYETSRPGLGAQLHSLDSSIVRPFKCCQEALRPVSEIVRHQHFEIGRMALTPLVERH